MSRSLRSLMPNRRPSRGGDGLPAGERAQPTEARRAPKRTTLTLVGLVLAGMVFARVGRRVEVQGPSMLPILADGDRLLIRPSRGVHIGDIVVLAEPDSGGLLAVKRVAALGPEGITVLGDNAAASRDSRAYGPVPHRDVVGRAWWRYYPPERAGRLQG